jgi:hypothetical protein
VSTTLVLKLVLTPVLIAAATLAGRRWGPSLSGWLVGLPFTSGPVILFLALDHGSAFAAAGALGVVLGVTSQAVFGLTYVNSRGGWPSAVLAGTAGFVVATVIFGTIRLPEWFQPPMVAISLAIAIKLVSGSTPAFAAPRTAEPADLPLRIVIGTALVVALTQAAPLLGARLSGLLSPFPLYAAILAVFAHRRAGPAAARLVWCGLFFGLFAFLGFFTVLAATLVPLGVGVSFGLAIGTALLIQGATLLLLRRLKIAAGEAPVGEPEHAQQPGDHP